MIRASYIIEPPEGSNFEPITVSDEPGVGVWIEQSGGRILMDHEDMVKDLARVLELPMEHL
jgi:hypothetical protein